jgi:hypothetical protein
MRFAHGAAGLTLVADRQLHGLPSAPSSSSPDILAWTDRRPTWARDDGIRVYTADYTDERGTPMLVVTRASEGYCFRYVDETWFWIDRHGAEIWMTWRTTFEDACTYLVGPVLGFALRLRGELAIHATAVQVGADALAIVGPHGAGKSTTAAAFARRGFPVLTDDILRVTQDEGGVWAHPFGGIIRLWPDSESLVYGASGKLPRITASWDKRALAIGAEGALAAERPVALGAIAFLMPRDDVQPRVTALRPAAAVVRLAANSTAGHLLDSPARAQEFLRIASIAATVPSADVSPGAGARSLDLFVDHLLQWRQTAVSQPQLA